MMALIRSQAERIRTLEERLDRMDRAGAATKAAVTPPQSSSAPAPAVALAQAGTVPPSRDTPARPAAPDPQADWSGGAPLLRSADRRFSFKPRGRILLDLDATGGSDVPGRNIVTTGARAARLGVEGTLYEKGFYAFDVEFTDPGATEILSAFVGFRDKLGTLNYDVRLGNMFNDRSLEGQTGSQSTPLLERSFVANAIAPRRSFYGVGATARLFGPGWHASLAIAGDPLDGMTERSDTLSVMSRAHWNPVRTDEGAVHIGAWGFHEWLAGTGRTLTRATIIGARFNSALRVTTGTLTGGDQTSGYGAEFAVAHRNFYAWSEYGRRDLRFLPGTQTGFSVNAWSVAGGWVITGERAPYSATQGNFRPVDIRRSLVDGGSGAFELVARYQELDNSQAPLGTRGDEATLGLNWYPVPLLRLMINGSLWRLDGRASDDQGSAVTTRLQLVF
ncbi:porin [Sphingomonas sp.]|uniref:OprO/OprP family phosphate-selective porin n=1 Tax=Sphingomonas sp. TaxID=28214 RepID=UPI0035C7FCE4